MKKLSSIILSLVLMTGVCFAQKAQVGVPYSFMHKDLSQVVDEIALPAVDVDALMAEDGLNMKNGTPLRVGMVHHVKYDFNNCGRVDELPNGAKLWRLSLSSKDALMMAVYFSQFNIPEGAQLFVYSNDRQQLTGTYTNEDVQENGVLASEDIVGDNLTIEYYEPADVPFHGVIEIDRIGHIYRDFLGLATSDEKGHWGNAEGDCHYNVVCPEGDNWRPQIRSVVAISITGSTGSYMCSGATINNTRLDKKPYVLTANHCLDGANSSFKFYFDYRTMNCNGNAGYYNKTATGGVVRANADLNTSSDFLLLEITGNLPVTYIDSIYFAGWDASGAASTGAVIHHPGGDYKKISFPKSVFSVGGSTGKYWRVTWYTNPNRGCTEQGSSGSPLFNATGKIIGDLSNGSSSCEYPEGYDNFGKFSHSWTNNNNSSNAKKLKPWLDPDNTGVLSLAGMGYNSGVGVADYNDQQYLGFSIVPNPSNGNVFFRGAFDFNEGVCNIYNAMGMLLSSEQLSLSPSFQMDCSNLNAGIYFVEIISDSKIFKSKMVITK